MSGQRTDRFTRVALDIDKVRRYWRSCKFRNKRNPGVLNNSNTIRRFGSKVGRRRMRRRKKKRRRRRKKKRKIRKRRRRKRRTRRTRRKRRR